MNKVRKWFGHERNHRFLVPLMAILLGFCVGTIIMTISGISPSSLFASLIRSVIGINVQKWGTDQSAFNPRFIGEYLVYCMPIILTGLSVAFAFRTGLFNIGAEGQVMVGSFVAIIIGLMLPGPKPLILLLMIVGGAAAGAFWGFVPGYLKARHNVHEVVVTIMLNYAALFLTNYFYKQIPGSSNSRTKELADGLTFKSEFLTQITGNSRLHWGFLLVILGILIFWFIIEKTTFGYELKAVGNNKDAARYAGMKVERNAVLSMMIAGAYAGLAGVVLAVGTFGFGRIIQATEGYGTTGIAVALVGGNTALGTFLGGLLFGALSAAKPIMQTSGIPRDIVIIISSMIILFVAMRNGIKRVLSRIGGNK